jgi:hypothetical protein
MRSWLLLPALFAAVTALGLVPEARAGGSVLVLGKASPKQRDVIAAAVIATARDGGWSFEAHAFQAPEREAVLACLGASQPWACMAQQMKDKGDQLVLVQVETERTDTVLQVHVVTAASDADSRASYFCNVCDDNALKLAVSDVTRRLLRAAAERSGKTKISIKSNPDRAWITLDGTLVGSTDTVRATYPGEHTVMFTRTGYHTVTHRIRVMEGETARLHVTLDPVPGTVIDRPGDPRAGPSRLLPKLLIGAGAVAVAGGTIYSLTAVDPPPGLEQPRYLYSGPAIGVAAAGGAMVGVGLYLWLRPSKPAAAMSPPAPAVSLWPGGGSLGWSTRF